MNDLEFRLIIYDSFLGNISGNIRTLSYEHDQNEIRILATTFDEPTDYDVEGIDCAITEIMSSVPSIISQNIKIFKDNSLLKDIPAYKKDIFIRKECEV